MQEFNYEEDIKINLDSLELDCQDHAEKVMKYAQEKVRLNYVMRNKKEEIGVLKAKLMRPTIDELTKENSGKKPTVGEIEAAIILNEGYQKLTAEINQLEYEFDLIKEALYWMSHRKEMLQEERALLAMGYYSRVSKTNGIRSPVQAQQREIADDTTRESVNQKRRERRK